MIRAAAGFALAVGLAAGAASAGEVGSEGVRAMIRSRAVAVLASEMAGVAKISEMSLRDGDRVSKSSVVVRFDCSMLSAGLDGARAGLAKAVARESGLAALVATGSVGKMDVAISRADADKARADLKLAAAMVDHCVVVAPFSGRVADVKARAAESVQGGAPLLTLVADSDLEVAMVAPAAWVASLAVGQSFRLAVGELGGREVAAVVSRIGAQIDPVSQTVTVYGQLPDSQGLIPGMSGVATFGRPALAAVEAK